MKKKINFNFDFLGKEKTINDYQNKYFKKLIFELQKIKDNASVLSSSEIKEHIKNLQAKLEKVSNKDLYDDLFMELISCADELIKYDKYNDALFLLYITHNVAKSEENKNICNEYIENLKTQIKQIEKEKENIEKKKEHEKNNTKDDFIRFIVCICTIIVLLFLAGFWGNTKKQNEYLSSLEQTNYSYYKKYFGYEVSNGNLNSTTIDTSQF